MVIDVSYPYKREREALRGRSTAEVIQQRLPRARVFTVARDMGSIPWTPGRCERPVT